MSKEFRLATGDEIRGALEYGDQVYVMLDTESSTAPVPPQDDAQPVAGQSRFTSQKDWHPCSYEHHLMVIANPSEWPGYETRALFTRSDADEVERLRIDLELTRLARQGDQIEIDGLKALCDGFRAQLADAAQSLETISLQAGRDEFMKDMTQIRGYANSRARVAQGALSASAEPNKSGAGEVKL